MTMWRRVGHFWAMHLLMVLNAGVHVNMAVLENGEGPVTTHALTLQMIRSEIQRGIKNEVDKHLQRVAVVEKQQSDTQFTELMTDLKELIASYDGKVQAQISTSGSSTCSALRMINTKMDNLTSLLSEYQRKGHQMRAQSCADLRTSGQSVSGIYTIHPRGFSPIEVYCDMTTDGGGWTVFQRRVNSSVDFYRNWLEYANGFGDVTGSYWLGLRALHHVTHNDRQELRIELADFSGQERYAEYDFFAVSSEYTKFRLDLGSYTGNAGDAMEHSRDHKFSTKDSDNDNHPNEHCSTRFTGGWWYNSCYRANLNGQYLSGAHRRNVGINWNKWLGDNYSLKYTVMMIRPVHFQS